MILDDLGWFGMIWDDLGWFGMIWDDSGWFVMIWDDLGWFGVIWDDLGWFGMIWDDSGWSGMIWDDLRIYFALFEEGQCQLPIWGKTWLFLLHPFAFAIPPATWQVMLFWKHCQDVQTKVNKVPVFWLMTYTQFGQTDAGSPGFCLWPCPKHNYCILLYVTAHIFSGRCSNAICTTGAANRRHWEGSRRLRCQGLRRFSAVEATEKSTWRMSEMNMRSAKGSVYHGVPV